MQEVKSEKIFILFKLKEITVCLNAGGDNLVRSWGKQRIQKRIKNCWNHTFEQAKGVRSHNK